MSGATGARIAHVAPLVRDDDEAIAGFTGKRDFVLVEDTPLGDAWRWVRVSPRGGGCEPLLARASEPAQATGIGRQGAGRVFLFLAAADFPRDCAAFRERSVRFLEAPRDEPCGTVAMLDDLCGNRRDLIEYRAAPPASPAG